MEPVNTVLTINNKKLTKIPDEIIQNPDYNVKSFVAFCNAITTIPSELSLFTNLTRIDFWCNKISHIPSDITKLTNLTTITFTENLISDLPQDIGYLVNLESCFLGSNHVSKLPPSFLQLHNLRNLYLTENDFKEFPNVLLDLNLEILDLNINPDICQIPQGISKMTSLTELRMMHTGLKDLPEEVGFLTNLKKLDLGMNRISYLPESFSKLENIKSFVLQWNDFDHFPEHLPPNLSMLYVGGNRSNLKIPDVNPNLSISPSCVLPNNIIPGLWLGSLESARHRHYLKQQNVTHILGIMKEYKPFYPNEFKYLGISIEDSDTEDLKSHFIEAVNFINSAYQEGGQTLVHCAAGISRSATIVIAFVMTQKKISFDEAFQIVQNKREVISPNPGFIEQLRSYQNDLKIEVDNQNNCILS